MHQLHKPGTLSGMGPVRINYVIVSIMEAILACCPALHNDWTGWRVRVKYDVFAQAPSTQFNFFNAVTIERQTCSRPSTVLAWCRICTGSTRRMNYQLKEKKIFWPACEVIVQFLVAKLDVQWPFWSSAGLIPPTTLSSLHVSFHFFFLQSEDSEKFRSLHGSQMNSVKGRIIPCS